MSGAIVTAGLGRRYGRQWAIRELTLTIAEGSIYGLLGSNGAGKTTTLRMLSTLLAPSVGTASVMGQDIRSAPRRVAQAIGYMPDSFGVYDDLTVSEYLDFYARAHGVQRGRRQIVAELLAVVGLEERRDSFVDVLSRGMKQRLGIARCLVHDPPVLLLDEPASGLDPLARVELQAVLTELARMGKTIIISSHILPELAQLCRDVGIIEDGTLLLTGRVADLLASAEASCPIEITAPDAETAARIAAFLPTQAGVSGVAVEAATVRATVEPQPGLDGALFVALGQAQLPVTRYGRRTVTLEDIYFQAIRGKERRIA